MADLRANVSSYNYETPSMTDQAAKFGQLQSIVNQNKLQDQQLQSGAVALDKDKLALMNTQFGLMNQELSAMSDDPSITKEQAAERLKRFSTTLKLPAEATNHMLQELQQAPNVKMFSDNALRRGMSVQERINRMYGTPTTVTDQQNVMQGVTASPAAGGGFTPSTRLPVQLPPGTAIADPTTLQPGIVGPAGPSGVQPVPTPTPRPGLRTAVEAPPMKTTGGIGPTIDRTPEVPTTFNNRFAGAFPNMVPTGGAPGQAGAMAAVAEQSGKDYAADLSRAKTLQADLQPDLAVLNILKGKGPTEFGPGTSQFSDIKKLIATWVPGVDPKIIQDAGDIDTVRKYLVQGARVSGNTGTNDQLAAAFEANPNTTMNTATIENIVKSRVALRKMQNAQTLLFGQQGLPASQYSDWIAKNQNQLDPRAFGFDMMSNEAKSKMLGDMAKQDNNGNWIAKKGKEKEFQKFEKSLSFANDAGLIEPPGRR